MPKFSCSVPYAASAGLAGGRRAICRDRIGPSDTFNDRRISHPLQRQGTIDGNGAGGFMTIWRPRRPTWGGGGLIRLIRERPRPRQEGGNRGRPPVRSEMGRRRFGFAGRPFHAGRGRDAAANA